MAPIKYILLTLPLILSGCSGLQIFKPTETYVPLVYCPPPPSISKPSIPLNDLPNLQGLSSEEQLGILAKYYTASLVTLIGYAEELQTALDYYRTVDHSYDELRQRLIQTINTINQQKSEQSNNDSRINSNFGW